MQQLENHNDDSNVRPQQPGTVTGKNICGALPGQIREYVFAPAMRPHAGQAADTTIIEISVAVIGVHKKYSQFLLATSFRWHTISW